MIKNFLARSAARFAPRLLWRYRRRSWCTQASEPEIALVPSLCSRRLTTADVGASDGEYSMHAIPFSGVCLLFEPRPDHARILRDTFMQAAVVEQVALSDTTGNADMRTPRGGASRSTIEPRNGLDYAHEVDVIRVPTRRLDEYARHTFGFIKIDVEGHEEAVLRGGLEIVRRDRPSLLIEIEERHNPGAFERIRTLLASFDYQGLFLHEKRLRDLAEFDVSTMQRPENICGGKKVGLYLNNFLFVQPDHRRRLGRWLNDSHA
jgi:FkbM family methyltransferase